MDRHNVYILVHAYGDGSGFSILRAYISKDYAERELALVRAIPGTEEVRMIESEIHSEEGEGLEEIVD